jgi:hypothetical protein
MTATTQIVEAMSATDARALTERAWESLGLPTGPIGPPVSADRRHGRN